MRILIVDESVTVRDRLAEMFSGLPGVEAVTRSGSPQEAIRAVHSGWPDAVVFDINMSGGGGTRLLEALRARLTPIVSLVLTNDSTPECRDACLAAGANFFFDKSWGLHNAVDVIARLARGDAHCTALPESWRCFDQLPIPAWLYDCDTFAFKAVNEAAVARYGYSRDTFLTMTLAGIQLIRGRVAGRQRHRDRDGKMLHVDVAVALLEQEGRRLGVALAYDIGDQVAAEAIVQRSAAAAHDFNNLLTIVAGRVQSVIDGLALDHPARAEASKLLDACSAVAEKLRELVSGCTSTGVARTSTEPPWPFS